MSALGHRWGKSPEKNARSRMWYRDHKGKYREYRIKMYGLTKAEYDAMLKAQDKRCAVCRRLPGDVSKGRHKHLCIDHNHTTGKVRGMLCVRCNTAIGMLEDSPDRCDLLAAYLRARD